MKIKKFFVKGKNFKFFLKVGKNFENRGGNLKQGGKCIMVSGGMDAPDVISNPFYLRRINISSHLFKLNLAFSSDSSLIFF